MPVLSKHVGLRRANPAYFYCMEKNRGPITTRGADGYHG